MTFHQIRFCCFAAIISLVGALALMAVALDIVSMPSPKAVAIHYCDAAVKQGKDNASR